MDVARDEEEGRSGTRSHERRGLSVLRPRAFRDHAFGISTIGSWFGRELLTEQRARSGFYRAPLGVIAGTALFYGADVRVPLALLLTLSLTLLAAALASRRSALRAMAMSGLFVLAGQGLATLELERTQTTLFSGEATVRISGRVVWRDVDDRGRHRYLIDIERTERPVLSRPPERARILVSSRHEPIPIGGRYDGLVRLRPPSGPAIPGSYDFAYAPFFQGLGAYGYSLGAPAPPQAVSSQDLSWSERIAALRVSMAERIRRTVDGAEGAVASALITGERAGIPDDVDEWLRITGLAHVLSISGFHMALIAGFTMLSVRAVASAIPGLALIVSTKKIAAIAALAVSTAYLLIAGDNVATQRSWIMLVIMLGAVLIDRPALTLRNVAIAAMLVLALNPHAVVTASFQMSFAATAALIGAYGAVMRRWNGREGALRPSRRGVLAGVLVTLCGLALSSLIAGGATAPYGAYHFQRAAPLGGVVANVLAMPLFSFWIMPAALIAVLAMPFGLDAPFLHLVGYGLALVFQMAERLAQWFPDHATGLMRVDGLLFLTGALLALCFFNGRLRWTALPMAVVGLALAPQTAPAPELLVFEDGKELALIDEHDRIVHLRPRPNDFVDGQWQRAFPAGTREPTTPNDADDPRSTERFGFVCENDICLASTRSGLTIAWTEDYEKTGVLCDSADVVIVSRAIRQTECRSGAPLVTLRTLRRTGSLAISKDTETGEPKVTRSITDEPREWNLHRHADWPEYWQNPDEVSQAERATIPSSGARRVSLPPTER